MLFRSLAARADLGRDVGQDRPAAVVTLGHRLAQHAAHQRAAAPAAAGAGADAGAFADLLESFRAALNRLEHGAFADLVAQACRLEILDDRLGFGVLLGWVDGAIPCLYCRLNISVAQFFTKLRTSRQRPAKR